MALGHLARHGKVLIIGRSSHEARKDERRRHAFARRTPGVTVVELVDLKRMMAFFGQLDLTKPLDAIRSCADLAREVMTKVPASLKFRDRITRIQANGTGRYKITGADQAALNLFKSPTYQSVSRLLTTWRDARGVHVFRPTIYEARQGALSRVSSGGGHLEAHRPPVLNATPFGTRNALPAGWLSARRFS